MGNSCKKRKSESRLPSEHYDKLISSTSYSKSEQENYIEYFKLIKHKLRRFYEENQHNQLNISLSLDKKDFNTVTTAKKIIINPSQKFVYWKDFLVHYLGKQSKKGFIWAAELKEIVKAEIFLSENKWLSLFFWQEFEMRTKPKCLTNLPKKDSLTNASESIESSSTDNNQLITDRLNGSFVSINTDCLSLNDPTHEYKEYRNKVRAYINIFKDHVFDYDHPIHIVAKYFVKIFSSFLQSKIKELYSLKNTNDPEFNKSATIICDTCVKAFQKFILKLQTALRLMYSKTINYQCFIEEKDEFINLITNLLFRDGKIYNNFFELFKICLFDQIKVLEGKFNELRKTKPQDLGISEKFCLNTITLNFQKKLLEDSKNKNKFNVLKEENPNDMFNEYDGREFIDDVNVNSYQRNDLLQKVDDQIVKFGKYSYNDFSDFSPNSNSTMKLNIQESLASHDKLLHNHESDLSRSSRTNQSPSKEIRIFSESDILSKSIKKNKEKDDVSKNINFKNKYQEKSSPSYESAIKLLKSVSKYKVPFEKMMLIATISTEITECVNNYWKEFENVITSSLLNIDADDLMTIFIYIIIKSNMSELLIHSKFIKEFTTSTTRSTMMGYYYTTLEASLIYILSIKDKSDLQNRDKMRQSLVPNKTSFIQEDERDDFTVLNINPDMTNHTN